MLAQGACGLVASWAGQEGVLAPWGCGCHPRLFRHLPSTSDLGVNNYHNKQRCNPSYTKQCNCMLGFQCTDKQAWNFSLFLFRWRMCDLFNLPCTKARPRNQKQQLHW